MSWLSSFLGMKKIRTPKVKKAEEIVLDDYGYGTDAYLRELEDKSGFEDTIITGKKKKKKLAATTQLG